MNHQLKITLTALILMFSSFPSNAFSESPLGQPAEPTIELSPTPDPSTEPAPGAGELESPLARAEREMADAHWKNARALLEHFIATANPERMPSLKAKFLLGIVLVRDRQWEPAIEAMKLPYAEGTFRNPSSYYLGLATYHLNKLDQATAYFDEALTSADHDVVVNTHYFLGMIAAGQRKLDDARGHFELVVNDPGAKDPIASFSRGMLALLLRPRGDGGFRPFEKPPTGVNDFDLTPDLSLPAEGTETFGGHVSLRPAAGDTNAAAAPGSLNASFNKGGYGAAFGAGVWARVLKDDRRDFGLHYKVFSSYLLSAGRAARAYDMRTHAFGIPYQWSASNQIVGSRGYRITPGASFTQGEVSGVAGLFPARFMDTIFVKAEVSATEDALRTDRYEVVGRVDTYRLRSSDVENPTGPGLSAKYRATTYSNFARTRGYYVEPGVDVVLARGRDYRRVVPSLTVGYEFPVRLWTMHALSEAKLGAAYFYDDPDVRFDQLARVDLVVTKIFSPKFSLNQTAGAAHQISNDSRGRFSRFVVTTNLQYIF